MQCENGLGAPLARIDGSVIRPEMDDVRRQASTRYSKSAACRLYSEKKTDSICYGECELSEGAVFAPLTRSGKVARGCGRQ